MNALGRSDFTSLYAPCPSLTAVLLSLHPAKAHATHPTPHRDRITDPRGLFAARTESGSRTRNAQRAVAAPTRPHNDRTAPPTSRGIPAGAADVVDRAGGQQAGVAVPAERR
jgi:hypothetical protein